MAALEAAGPIAQGLVELALNGLVPGLAIALLVWVILRLVGPNATTKYAIWFATLLAVIALPLFASVDLGAVRPFGPAVTAPAADSAAPAATAAAQPTETPAPAVASSPAQSDPDGIAPGASASPAGGLVLRPVSLPQLLIWFLLGAYLMGAGILLVQRLRSYLSLGQLKRSSQAFEPAPGSPVQTSLKAGRRTVALRRSERITVPMAAGLARPMILIPADLEGRLGEEELDHVVLHELAHLARGDDWSKFVQQILQALFFFHPAVHAIGWQLDLEREIASDDWVVAQRGRKRLDYASSLVRLVELALHTKRMRQPLVEGSAVMVKTQIERRIRLLLDGKRSISERFAAGRFLAAVGAVAVAGALLAQITLFAIAQISGRSAITVENAASITHLVEVEVTDWVGTVTFSPDGSYLISDRGDPSIVYWNLEDLTPLGEPLVGHAEAVNSLTLSPDGTLLASSGEEGTLRFWNVETREPLTEALTVHEGGINNVTFGPDGTRVASFGWDGNLILWDAATQTVLANETLDGHGDWSCEARFSPDGSLLATSGANGVIHLWDAGTLELVADLEGHTDWSCAKAFSPDGSILATGDSSSRGQLIFWDVATREMIGNPRNAHPSVNFFSMAFSPDGSLLASGGSNGFHLWDVASQNRLTELAMRPSPSPLQGFMYMDSTSSLEFSPDGTLLAAGLGTSAVGGEVHLWGIEPAESAP